MGMIQAVWAICICYENLIHSVVSGLLYVVFHYNVLADFGFPAGAGALCSPLIATQFSQLPRWSFHFLASLGVAFLNIVLLITVFRLKTQDRKYFSIVFLEPSYIHSECLAQIGMPPREKDASETSHFRQMLSLKVVHLFALFLLLVMSLEVTIGGTHICHAVSLINLTGVGWSVTYIIDVRGGGPSSGYISSGFYAGIYICVNWPSPEISIGLMIGTAGFLWVNQKVRQYITVPWLSLSRYLSMLDWGAMCTVYLLLPCHRFRVGCMASTVACGRSRCYSLHWYDVGPDVSYHHEPCRKNIATLAINRCVLCIDVP